MRSPRFRFKKPGVLPGFGISLGFAVTYLSLIVLIPLSAIFLKTATMHWARFVETVTSPRVMASYRLDLWRIVSWRGNRLRFRFYRCVGIGTLQLSGQANRGRPGRSSVRFADRGCRHLANLAVCSERLARAIPSRSESMLCLRRLGVVVALTFIGLPFVVRSVQPVIQDLGSDVEEASASLGANSWQTFCRVIFPDGCSRSAHRFYAGLCPRPRRIRLHHLHLRQHAHAHRDHLSADRQQA